MAATIFPTKCQECDCVTNTGVYFIPSTNEWFLVEEVNLDKRKIDSNNVVLYCSKCYIKKSLVMGQRFLCVNCHVYTDDYNMPKIEKGKTEIGGNGGIGFFEFTVPFDNLPIHLQCDGSICQICLIKLYQDGLVKRQDEINPFREDGYHFDSYYLKTVKQTNQNPNNYPSKCRNCEKDILEYDGLHFIPTLNQWFLQKDILTQNRNIDSKRVLFYCDNCYVKNSLGRNNYFKCTNCHIYNNNVPSLSIKKGKLTTTLYEFADIPNNFQQNADICASCFDTLIEKQVIKKLEKPSDLTWDDAFAKLNFIGAPEKMLKEEYSEEFIEKVGSFMQKRFPPKNVEVKETDNELVAVFKEASARDNKYRLIHKIIEMAKLDEKTTDTEIETAIDYYDKNKGKQDVYCHKCHKQWDSDDKTEFVKGGVQYWAIFKDHRIFTYMGKQVLTSEEIKSDTYPVHVCNQCLKRMTYEKYLSVSCDNCHGLHMDMHHSGGVHCSSSVGELGIFSGDGSDYDQDRFTWVNGIMPDYLRKVDLICDNCIKQLLDNDIIEYKYKFIWG